MKSKDEFIEVPVPLRYVTKVYELIARLESEAAGSGASEVPRSALTQELVERIYSDSWDPHRRLLRYLADHAGEWLTTGQIANALSLEHGNKSLAGSMGAIARRSNHRYGGVLPWESRWNNDQGQQEHRMSPEVAAWVSSAAS